MKLHPWIRGVIDLVHPASNLFGTPIWHFRCSAGFSGSVYEIWGWNRCRTVWNELSPSQTILFKKLTRLFGSTFSTRKSIPLQPVLPLFARTCTYTYICILYQSVVVEYILIYSRYLHILWGGNIFLLVEGNKLFMISRKRNHLFARRY